MKVTISITLGTLLLAGCTVGPNFQTPKETAPGKWASSQADLYETSPVRADWWRSFNDPQLTKVVEAAARSNKDLDQAAARVREARALRQVTASSLFPNIGASASTIKETISDYGRIPAGAIPALAKRRDVFETGFDASWELDVFGGNRRKIEAADARLAGVEHAERATRLSILAETARNYLELRGAQRQLAIVDANLALQQRTLNLTKDKLRVGTGTELEVARAEGQLRATEARMPNLNAEIAAGAYRLSILTGQPPATLLDDLVKRKPLPAPPDIVPVGLPSDLLRRRPDIRRAERELAAATADVGVAVADLFPKFSLTGAAGVEALHFSDLFQSGSATSRLGPQIRWPIFQSGKIRANIKASEARADAAIAAYEQTVLTALGETETTLERYGRELQTRRKLQAAVAANQRAVELSTQRFESGAGTLFEVIDAEARVLAIETELVESETAIVVKLATLYKALGGGWK
ncbi:MAG: NodT family efflux transporter outer membrane factor (OMF) lipoprotein [Verrucomicrobiales bacterium]|jgi:NodT family efflux transporter outer membrane factor (OMF) lipoprotein